ncbi:unnamed protein product [Closterium sp. NIES-53]
MQLQGCPRESLTSQQLRERNASWGCRGGRSGSRPGVDSSGASGSGQVQLQHRPREALSPQQLREWYAQSRGSLSTARCPYVIRTGVRTGQPCGTVGHTGSRCLARLSDAWCTEFGNDAELPAWVELLRQRVEIFALDYDAILTAMYALSTSAEGACHGCLPPDPSIQSAALGAGEAAALGACTSPAPSAGEAAALGAGESTAPGAGESALSGAAPAAVLHTFTLDSGASRSFFRDSTTLTPLSRPVAVSLADPSRGLVLAHSSTVLPCPAAPSGLLSGLHLPSFSTNLVSGADLQDAWVDQFTPGGQRVTHCTCSRTGRHLATFTCRPGSSLYTLTTAPPPIPASGQVAVSSQVFAAASRSSPASAPCSCRPLAHETLLWHHRLGHPSLPRLRGMASRALVSGLPRSLPPLPPGPAPTCVPCVEGRQRAAPHSSFPPTEAPLQTLHMDVWGPARVRGQGHELLRYFLARELQQRGQLRLAYVASQANTADVFTKALQPCDHQPCFAFLDWSCDLLFSPTLPMGLLPIFCCRLRSGTLRPAFPCRRLRPHCVGRGRFVMRRCSGSGVLVPLSAIRAWTSSPPTPFPAPGLLFYHSTSRRVLPSQDVTFYKLVPFYRLFPYRSAPLPPPPLFLAPGPSLVDPLPPHGPAPSSVSQVDPPPGAVPGEVVVDSGAATCIAFGGAEPEVLSLGVLRLGMLSLGGLSVWVLSLRVLSLGVLRRRVRSLGVLSLRVLLRLEVLLVLRQDCIRSSCVSSLFGAHDFGVELLELEVLEPLEQEVLALLLELVFQEALRRQVLEELVPGVPKVPGLVVLGALELETLRSLELLGLEALAQVVLELEEQSLEALAWEALELEPASPLPAPSPYTEKTDGLIERRAPASRPASPVRTVCGIPRPRPPPVPGTHVMQELRWLTYLLTGLGEQRRSPPVMYVDNKAMIALCQEHITKHIALRYFLARELQQRGQLRLAYVATRANTADIFTKALPPGDHQRFSTVLGLVPTLPHLLTT